MFCCFGTLLIDQYYSSSVSDVLPYKVQSASSKNSKLFIHHITPLNLEHLKNGKQIRQLVEENEDIFHSLDPTQVW